MSGLFYKELRQNRLYLILIPAAALLCPFYFLIVSAFINLFNGFNGDVVSLQELMEQLSGRGESALAMPMILMFYVMAFFITSIGQSVLFQQDETKKWGYFTASHPKGIKGAMYAKYLLTFLMSLLTMVSLTFADYLFILIEHLVLGTKPEEMTFYSMLFQILLFIQMFFRAFDVPFTVRFGSKRGMSVKVALILALILGGFIYLMFGPLPESPEVFFEKIYDFVVNMQNGAASEWLSIALGAFLWVTIGAYVLSYHISCKLYLKGVEQYDK